MRFPLASAGLDELGCLEEDDDPDMRAIFPASVRLRLVLLRRKPLDVYIMQEPQACETSAAFVMR